MLDELRAGFAGDQRAHCKRSELMEQCFGLNLRALHKILQERIDVCAIVFGNKIREIRGDEEAQRAFLIHDHKQDDDVLGG